MMKWVSSDNINYMAYFDNFIIIDVRSLNTSSPVYQVLPDFENDVLKNTYIFRGDNPIQSLERKRKFLFIVKDNNIFYTLNSDMNTFYKVCRVIDDKESVAVYWKEVSAPPYKTPRKIK